MIMKRTGNSKTYDKSGTLPCGSDITVMEKTVMEKIRERYSCRTYTGEHLSQNCREKLGEIIVSSSSGPFGTESRISLLAAHEGDTTLLKQLGTYGMIKKPAAFIAGAVHDGPGALEDFGYRMESIILAATGMGIGTCWLGGTFSRGSFAARMELENGEIIPAVVSAGYAAKKRIVESAVRAFTNADYRKPWDVLFFNGEFNSPLSPVQAGEYADVLEMVRLAPSASNHQPWRILKDGNTRTYHFYLERTRNYLERNFRLFGMADMQRIDMGIAMCHFELSAREAGCKGNFVVSDPRVFTGEQNRNYVATWEGNDSGS